MTYSRTAWSSKVNAGDPITISDHDTNDDDIVSFINDLESKVIFKTDEIGTSNIADSAITTDKITNNNITTTKIADGAVTTVKIANGNVTEAKLANDAVTEDKIKNGNVTTNKIYNGSVNASKLASNAVETAKIKDGNVTEDKLASNSVTTAKIKDGNVTDAKLASSFIKNNASSATITNLTTNTVYAGKNFKINPSGLSIEWNSTIMEPAGGVNTILIWGNPNTSWVLAMTNYTSGEIVFFRNNTDKSVTVHSANGTPYDTIPSQTAAVIVCLSSSLVFVIR